MTTADRPLPAPAPAALEAAAEEQPLDSGVAPLLFVFLVPLLLIVGLVLWIGAATTWLVVGITMATIGVMTGLVMLAINRLLADGGAEH
ncbi:hypothetical protein [Conexibacter arvalis]|uniref:Fatty acid desaturase n=1 Tax=Conexibacter arvalis TaxID=912552 RepID=A0A840IG94_9ACTN|nr:hypothetical protein [Conexibacter arvalis]MBB4662960.1 fatty acid desaturase [Conexibacter arvalis]